MAVPLVNTFEGGSDGTAITTGNSGGASGNAFTTVNIGATHTVTYENSPALTESLCAVITAGVTNGWSEFLWESSVVGTIGPTVYTRLYFRHIGAFVTNAQRIMMLSFDGTQRCTLAYIPATRKFSWTDSADTLGTSSTMAMSQDTTYRFECQWTLSATLGRAVINCYSGDQFLETLNSGATQNFGSTTINQVNFGLTSGASSANQGPIALDGLAIGTTGYFGPIGTVVPWMDTSQFPKPILRAPVPVRW